jgi:hypothetical protein
MAYFRGSTAPQLDFEGFTTTTFSMGPAGLVPTRPELRLAVGGHRLRGPDKYKVLELRRRRAQIEARRVLGLF